MNLVFYIYMFSADFFFFGGGGGGVKKKFDILGFQKNEFFCL